MTCWTKRILAVAALSALLAVVWTLSTTPQASAVGEKGGAAGGPAYSVVFTEGHNLIVTDNKTNKLFFYTIDKDAAIGSPLKLRGHIDLSDVGKDVLKPSKVAKAD